MKAQGKNIVVTGGGNGVGRELVLKLLGKGATVFAADINEEALQETLKLVGNSKRLFTYQESLIFHFHPFRQQKRPSCQKPLSASSFR